MIAEVARAMGPRNGPGVMRLSADECRRRRKEISVVYRIVEVYGGKRRGNVGSRVGG